MRDHDIVFLSIREGKEDKAYIFLWRNYVNAFQMYSFIRSLMNHVLLQLPYVHSSCFKAF